MHRTILIVDDDFDLRDTIRDLLEDEGYVVALAENGAVALQHLHAGCSPCVILLDLMMPVMDGYRFCDERAKDPALTAIPIVVFSAVARLDKASVPAGVADVLRKPMNLAALLSVVDRYCLAA